MAETDLLGVDEAQELRSLRLKSLSTLMSDISEDCWCAGWINGNETALFRMVFQDAPRRYGMGDVREADVSELRRLAEATGCWFQYGDEGEEMVPLNEFRDRLSIGDV